MIRRYLAGYEKVDLEVYDVSVQRAEGSADVKLRVEFSGRAVKIRPRATRSMSWILPLRVVITRVVNWS